MEIEHAYCKWNKVKMMDELPLRELPLCNRWASLSRGGLAERCLLACEMGRTEAAQGSRKPVSQGLHPVWIYTLPRIDCLHTDWGEVKRPWQLTSEHDKEASQKGLRDCREKAWMGHTKA